MSFQEFEKVESWLDENVDFAFDYFVRKASRQTVYSWLLLHSVPRGMVPENSSTTFRLISPSLSAAMLEKISVQECEKCGFLRHILSTTVDSIQNSLSLSLIGDAASQSNSYVGRKNYQELRAIDERKSIFNICNNLKIISIYHKILLNGSINTEAGRCLIFLVKGYTNRCPISQLLDISCCFIMEQVQQKKEIMIPRGTGIVGYVTEYSESLNKPYLFQEDSVYSRVDQKTGNERRIKLHMLILNLDGGVKGVVQIINQYRREEPLTDADKKSIAPSAHVYRLKELKFKDFSLDDESMLKACLGMFKDLHLIERFRINYDVLSRWLLSVRENYKPERSRSWRHAFNVTQMMFACLKITKLWQVFGDVETLSLLIACLCHELDHEETNNSYQIKTYSPLAKLYSTSTTEHQHFDQCIRILNSDGNQILNNLSPGEYSTSVHVLEDAILATNLNVHLRKRSTFFHMVNTGKYDWKREDNRKLLRTMLMTACDVATITKSSEVQRVDMMNRDKNNELLLMQVRFRDSICVPLYEAFAKISDKL